jgi:hypothetical protein
MAYITRPNSWVSQDAAATTQLTYALQLNPAPLTVSIAGRDPILGSLEFVITNPTATAISLDSVEFTIQVGTTASDLTATTANIGTSVSDSTNWQIQSPGTITSGPAVYTLSPQTGTSVSVAPGTSVVVEIFDFPTVENPGNTIINIKETTGAIGFTSFQVTTFPSGFYFNGLSATAANGSQLTPVAQVSTGSTVTLVWNSSVADLGSFDIYYSDAAAGQQHATPSDTGTWTSGQLTTDTVFTIVVTVSVAGGSPLTAALSTSISVQNPSLIAASITTPAVIGPVTVSGAMQTDGITATGVIVNGNLSATGTLTAASETLTGGLSADSATLASSLSVSGNGVFNIDAPGTPGGRFTVQNSGNVGINQPNPGASLDIIGNLNVSNGATINGNTTVTGHMTTVNGFMNLCPAPDASQGTVAIGGNGSWNSILTVSNNRPDGWGISVYSAPSTNNAWALYVQGPCINTSGSWSQISDLTLKTGVEPYTDSLAQVLKINPIRYYFKEEAGLGAKKHIGIAAQELKEIAPSIVGTCKLKPDSKEEYLTIDSGAMTYMLINAVKELNAEIETLKTELKTLKDK